MAGGGKLTGLTTDVLSSTENYRGAGLAPMLYKSLVDAGQVLFSSRIQTPGGQAAWRKLISQVSDTADVAGVADGYEAFRLLRKNDGNEHNTELIKFLKKDSQKLDYAHANGYKGGDTYLLMGNVKALDKVVYGNDSMYWVIAPHGTLDRYEQFAIYVDANPKPASETLVNDDPRPVRRRPAWHRCR